MAQRRRRAKKKSSGVSPVAAMLFGLAVGLSVAAAVYMKDRGPTERTAGGPSGPSATPASLQGALDDNGETAVAEPAEKKEPRFTFYEDLPNFEVVTRDDEPAASTAPRAPEPQAIVEPGTYMLQAGSFSTNDDADRRRAELAMHGIESYIQRVTINERNYHRVLIGPIDDLDELNMMRSRLRAAQIDVLRIRWDD